MKKLLWITLLNFAFVSTSALAAKAPPASDFVRTMEKQMNRDYAVYLKKAQRPRFAAKAKEYHLTNDELVAVYSYTVDLYGPLNEALRAGGDKAKNVEAFKKTLSSALSKIPATKGPFFRSTQLPLKIEETYKEGAIVSDPAFTSAGLSLDKNAHDQILIHSKTGRLISPLSARAEEGEVLFAPDTKFKVIKVGPTPQGQKQYELEEI